MSKVRLAIIGCGGNSSGHARRMNQMDEVQIIATCDVNTDIANSYIDQNILDLVPRPGAFDDVNSMLAETQPDAVLISTPHTLHFEHGMKALEAGCHVLMEKPMTIRAADAKALLQLAQNKKRILDTPCVPPFRKRG
ncbi:MAG: hypothetical protein COA56_15475 [Dehalococcoidia bacterium]|nr:MAG: hypothetical protein COA56_15475 [Dehalococcoidia bacterium]